MDFCNKRTSSVAIRQAQLVDSLIHRLAHSVRANNERSVLGTVCDVVYGHYAHIRQSAEDVGIMN